MGAKKNKAKNPSKGEGYSKRINRLELPQEFLQSLHRNRKGNQIHCVINNVGVTKTWAPTASRRCGSSERRWPQLLRADESAYFKHFAADCPFTAERIARLESEIKFKSDTQSSREKYESTLVDPFNFRRHPLFQNVERSYYMDFTDTVYLDGKIYALSLQGTLVVVEEIDSTPTITGVASNRAVPSSLGWRFFREHLVGLDGEIILVLLIHQETLGVVDGVEVFRLCLHKLKWIKGEGIGGKVLCLEPRFVWGNSQEIGCKGDRIYFTQASFSGWMVYDMETRSISCV